MDLLAPRGDRSAPAGRRRPPHRSAARQGSRAGGAARASPRRGADTLQVDLGVLRLSVKLGAR